MVVMLVVVEVLEDIEILTLLKHQVVAEVVKHLYLFILEQHTQLQSAVVVQFQVVDKEEMMELLVQYQEVI